MTRQEEMATGLQLLTQIFNRVGLKIKESKRPWPDRDAVYVVFGNDDRSTDIVLTGDFLADLPGSRDHKMGAESYAQTIAGRIKCGSADAFFCRSGIPVELEISWPIHTSATSDRR